MVEENKDLLFEYRRKIDVKNKGAIDLYFESRRI
jgi:hypothetical protein